MFEFFMFADRKSSALFWLGSVFVVAGVLLHIPMFLMAREMHFVLAGMPMGKGMLLGMVLILGGVAAAAYGLQPKEADTAVHYERVVPPEDAPLTAWHFIACGALAAALVIDVMKPATLGFVTPGMKVEYEITQAMVALFPLAALAGLTLGSFMWGALSDLYGRRATILLSAVMFVGTSICGAMPSLNWNAFMCFLMGLSAGGMLPVAYALLAEIMPTRYRNWSLVIVGGIGAIGGFLAASGFSAILQPIFGWRIMWFLNLPTGLILILLAPLIPESARFLLHIGRPAEARATLKRFGSKIVEGTEDIGADHSHLPPIDRRFLGTTIALTVVALAWGFVNFGLLLWLPGELISEGRNIGATSTIITKSSIISIPVVAVAAVLYAQWSTKGALLFMIGTTALGLTALILRQNGMAAFADPVIPVTMIIVGLSGLISVLLPYAAENYPLHIRGRATGWVAGCSKAGGLICQGLSFLALVPAFGTAAAVILVTVLAGFGLTAVYGRETRGRDLRELERQPMPEFAAGS